MKNVFNLQQQPNPYQNDMLFKIYNNTIQQKDTVHNLCKSFKLPFLLKLILNLDLSFSPTFPPSFHLIEKSFTDGLRKIGWKLFFQTNNLATKFTEIDQLIWKCKNKNKFSSNFCREIHEKVFPSNAVPLFSSRLQLKHSKDTLINKTLLGNVKDLVTKNKIVIKKADKNSGVTLTDKEDY